MASDAPDWQRVVNVAAGPALTDAPDWEHVVVGPGGSAVGGGGADYWDWALDGSLVQTWPNTLCFNTVNLSTYVIELTKFVVRSAKTVSKAMFYGQPIANPVIADQNYIGIYSYVLGGAMTLLGVTPPGACDVPFGGTITTPITVDLVAPVALSPGTMYYAAVLCNTAFVGSGNLLAIDLPQDLITETFDGSAICYYTTPSTLAYTSLPASIAAANLTVGVHGQVYPFAMAFG